MHIKELVPLHYPIPRSAIKQKAFLSDQCKEIEENNRTGNPGSQASSRGEAKDSALLSSRDAGSDPSPALSFLPQATLPTSSVGGPSSSVTSAPGLATSWTCSILLGFHLTWIIAAPLTLPPASCPLALHSSVVLETAVDIWGCLPSGFISLWDLLPSF